MSKKSVTFNIKNVNVHVCNSVLEEIDQPERKNPLEGVMESLKSVKKSVDSRLMKALTYINNAAGVVKNDQDFRAIVHAILNQDKDIILETPEATAFLRGMIERNFFEDGPKKEKEKEKEPAPAEANGVK